MELINKKDAIHAVLHNQGDAAVAAVQNIKAVDAVPVVHGYNTREDYPSLFGCSVCGWECDDTYYCDTDILNYCPNCGAKMDGKEKTDADS